MPCRSSGFEVAVSVFFSPKCVSGRLPMRLTKIGHVLIAVHDLARSRDFYSRVLGFEILEEDPEHGGVFMTIGEGTHVIDLVALPGTQPPPVPESMAEL